MSRPAELSLQSFLDASRQEFADTVRDRGSVRRTLRFGDRAVGLEFAGEALATALLPALRPRVLGASADPDVRISLWESTTPLPWRDQDLAARGLLRGHDGDPVTIVHEAGSTAVTMVPDSGDQLFYRVRSAQVLPWWERAAPLRPALSWALAGKACGLVHGGCVGDGRGGVLLAGAGGSGKTTTAMAAVEAGWRYVGDDYVLLDVAGPPMAHNLFGTAKLDAGHLRRFPRLAAEAGPMPADPDEKAVLDVAADRPSALADALAVRAVVVPQITGGDCRFRRISGADALLALAPSTVFQMPYDNGMVVRLISRLVRRVPCYGMDVGDDPAALADALGRVLDEAAS